MEILVKNLIFLSIIVDYVGLRLCRCGSPRGKMAPDGALLRRPPEALAEGPDTTVLDTNTGARRLDLRAGIGSRYEGIVVNRSLNGEGYMLPLGGPEFWLQAELQDAMDRLIRGHFKDVLAMPRAPYPTLELSLRMTSTAGRCYPDTGEIKLATLYHRDHGLDQTLMVLKHELAHWAARWRYGRRIAPHGREFRAVAHELDPRITITCPPFAAKERAQRRTWQMQCPRCRKRYTRGRRDQVACRTCCDSYASGNYDRRFRLVALPRA